MNENYSILLGSIIISVALVFGLGFSIAVIDGQQFENLTLKTTSADTPSIDAFGRLRVSEVTSVLDIKQLGHKDPLFIDEELNGGATSVYENSGTTMSTSSSGDWVVRQTYQRAFYQNGKSQQLFFTFTNFQPETNILKRVGYYTSNFTSPYNDNFDGLFLSSEGGTIYTNVYLNGVIVEKTAQADWVDPLDGTGKSGITIDWSKSQILLVDFEWLGVGRVRWNLVIDGMIYHFHSTNNANNIEGVYMLSPNKPMRWEIRQTGAGSGSFSHICSTVGTEGSINRLGVERSVNTDGIHIDANSVGTKYAVIGIRLNETGLDSVVDVLRFNLLGLTNDNYYWELHLNPVFNTPPTWSGLNNSGLDYFLGQSILTSDGVILDSGYAVSRTVSSDEIDNALRLGADINGVSDYIVLMVSPLSINLDVHGSLTYREVR